MRWSDSGRTLGVIRRPKKDSDASNAGRPHSRAAMTGSQVIGSGLIWTTCPKSIRGARIMFITPQTEGAASSFSLKGQATEQAPRADFESPLEFRTDNYGKQITL